MVWKTFTQEQIGRISRLLFMPFILLINYTLLLYLLAFYWTRRSEPRVLLLFAVGTVGVLCLVPFADPDDDTIGHLNDTSESCCVLTFLLQITIIGRDLNKKIKFRTVQLLTYAAELLIVADLVMVLLSLVVVFKRDFLTQNLQETLPNICENITLAFIFGFRYYYIIMSRGVKDLWTSRKVEICWYVLFATHELPFKLLENASGLPWEFAQSLWNRITLAGCLWITARTKLRESSQQSVISRHSVSYPAQSQPRSGTRSGNQSARLRSAKAYVIAVQTKA